ncbi:flagellar hook-length control protein FliK [Bradyrhizobium sp.]
MPISINPIFPVIAAQGAAGDVVLQPGTVIDAQVLKILANDLVRIAIANLSIEVLSEIPLQVGQTLRLAVSQMPEGIKLAVVGQGLTQGGEGIPSSAGEGVVSPNIASPDLATPAAKVSVSAETKPAPEVTPPKNPLTPLQAIAVSAAAQTAATRQGSLAPLFANLGVVAVSDAFPEKLQQAVAPLLALRPQLDQNLTGNDVKAAFKSSGLFLESSLASGYVAPSSAAGVPDLKAVLIVLRQTLLTLGNPQESASVPAAATVPQPQRPAQVAPDISAAGPAPEPHIAASPTLAPTLISEIDVEEVFLPQARLPVADDFLESNGTGRIFTAAPMPPNVDAGTRATTTGAILNLLQEALQAIPQKAGSAAKLVLNEGAPPDPLPSANGPQRAPRSDDLGTARSLTPPPPFRAALPSAQPAVPPSLTLDMPLAAAVHHLLDDTDAAIARQTLLQVASLPDRADIAGPRTDPAAPRWNFEIPFATAAGTAVAQFEISRDGTASEIDAAKRVWRARFSLDVEPAGPIHALISLSGDKTSVRMWAERPATAMQLRAGAAQLSQALSRAELQPSDIVIRDGAPLQPSPAPAGHFLDRAL